MKCKCCKSNIEMKNISRYVLTNVSAFYNEKSNNIPSWVRDVYRNHKCVEICNKCNTPIDYIDLPLKEFFNWASHCSDLGSSQQDIGKAVLRYFGLSELLQSKAESGE